MWPVGKGAPTPSFQNPWSRASVLSPGADAPLSSLTASPGPLSCLPLPQLKILLPVFLQTLKVLMHYRAAVFILAFLLFIWRDWFFILKRYLSIFSIKTVALLVSLSPKWPPKRPHQRRVHFKPISCRMRT